MKPQEAAPQGGAEGSSQVFTVVARLEIDDTLQATSGPKVLRIVEGTDPASICAARITPGGDLV